MPRRFDYAPWPSQVNKTPGWGGGSGGLDWGEAAKLGTRVLTSSTTNTLLRGIFGTLTGSPARRRR